MSLRNGSAWRTETGASISRVFEKAAVAWRTNPQELSRVIVRLARDIGFHAPE